MSGQQELAEAVRRAAAPPAPPDARLRAPEAAPGTEKWLLRVEDVAELLDIGRTRVYELIRDGELQSVKIGGSRRVPSTVLHAYVRRLLDADHSARVGRLTTTEQE